MRPGDRFRFVRDSSNGGALYGREGEIGTVLVVYNDLHGTFLFDNPQRRAEVGFNPNFTFSDIVPVDQVPEAAPTVDNTPETTFYTVMYRTTGGGLRISGGLSEQDAIAWQNTYPNLPVVKLMKIKVRV